MTPALSCRGASVSYGGVVGVDEVSFDVAPGETVALLGPSGSGKSTLLYAVAGFVALDGGEISVAGASVSTPGIVVQPDRRSVAMVFQNYALWPHLTALETVAYPLRRSGEARGEARRRAAGLLELVGIGDLGGRKPGELSGGQQQRVGLARALAREAAIYLFDEPTAHLDAAVRDAVFEEIARRTGESGAATVYATHDAAEALAVADRLVLLRDGSVVQDAPPQIVYDQPVDRWAARLTGPVSVVDVDVPGSADAVANLGECQVAVAGPGLRPGRAPMLVRPEWVTFGGPVPGVVRDVWYRGSHTDYRVDTAHGPIDVRRAGPPTVSRGSRQALTVTRGWIPADPADGRT